MKLISLNTWGGRAGKEKLLRFFEAHKDIDIFCLQEVWSGGEHMLKEVEIGGVPIDGVEPQIFSAIASVLPDYISYFRALFFDYYGLVIFIKRDIAVLEEGEVFVYRERGFFLTGDIGNHARNIQHITIETSQGRRTIVNFHGAWGSGWGKGDNPERLLQSEKIVAFFKMLENPFILCGDFNLSPETESLKKIEDFGLRNLIKEHGITSTRTSFYPKENRFADYALVSEGVEVKDFDVLPDEVSDHSPLYLEFE
jgi:exonuclease III